MYLNGIRVATTTNANSLADVGTAVEIGRFSNGGGIYAGYISGVRIVKGTAVYTGTTLTVPTAPLTAITNTSLLANFTNAGIVDSTAKNDLETVGNAQISTTQSKFGGSSMYFDGTGDWLNLPNSQNLTFGTGDFTIEFWIRPSSVSTALQQIFTTDTSATPNTNALFINFRSGADIAKIALTNNTTQFAISSALSANTWYHIAVVRSSGSSKIYVDGVGGTAVTCTVDFVTVAPNIGYGATANLTGYLDDFRITKGYARYTSNFTPHTAAFPLQ